jgi:hypothetical protein
VSAVRFRPRPSIDSKSYGQLTGGRFHLLTLSLTHSIAKLIFECRLFSDRGVLRLIQLIIGQKPAGLHLASTLRPLTAFINHSFGMAARSRELPGRTTDPPVECRAKCAGGFIAYLIRQLVQRHVAAT